MSRGLTGQCCQSNCKRNSGFHVDARIQRWNDEQICERTGTQRRSLGFLIYSISWPQLTDLAHASMLPDLTRLNLSGPRILSRWPESLVPSPHWRKTSYNRVQSIEILKLRHLTDEINWLHPKRKPPPQYACNKVICTAATIGMWGMRRFYLELPNTGSGE